jgi:hypothetical protein
LLCQRNRYHTLLDVRLVALLIGFLLLGLVIACAFACAGRVELRQRGGIISGLWLPWSSIESYAWQDTDREFVVLKVRSKKWLMLPLSFGWKLEIILSAAQKSATDAVLKRQLAEWPGT